MQHAELMKILRTVKCVLLCSTFDASPNLLTESLEAGCVPILSYNIGNSDLIHSSFIVADYRNIDEWVDKVHAVLDTEEQPCGTFWTPENFQPLHVKLLSYIAEHIHH